MQQTAKQLPMQVGVCTPPTSLCGSCSHVCPTDPSAPMFCRVGGLHPQPPRCVFFLFQHSARPGQSYHKCRKKDNRTCLASKMHMLSYLQLCSCCLSFCCTFLLPAWLLSIVAVFIITTIPDHCCCRCYCYHEVSTVLTPLESIAAVHRYDQYYCGFISHCGYCV